MSEKSKNFLLYGLIFISSLPFVLLVNRPEILQSEFPLKSLALYLSSVLGFLGIIMLVWQLALGTRSISGLFTVNFASKLKVHKNLGIYGTLLIFLHPLLVTIGYGESWLYSFLLHFDTGYEKAVTYGRVAFYLLIIIWISSALLRGKIKFRPWKYIHYLSYPILILSILHIPSIGKSFNSSFIEYYWYIVVFVIIICFILRLRYLFGFGKLSYSVIAKENIAPGVHALVIQSRGNYIDIMPGQFIYLQYSFMGEEHPFSVLDYDNQTGKMVIVYKEFGKFTKNLTAAVNLGDTVLIDGPYGNFLHETSEKNILISGGVGFTPFYKLAKENNGSNIFIRAVRKTEDLFMDKELSSKLGSNYVRLLSDDQSSILPGSFSRGYFSAELLNKLNVDVLGYKYFICGPLPMINLVVGELKASGVPAANIATEEFAF